MSKKRILIIGKGFLGNNLSCIGQTKDYETIGTSTSNLQNKDLYHLDVTNFSQVNNLIKDLNPDYIINCAANANVDFFSGTTYYYLGIPADLYPTIFAMSRVAGWIAHYFEQFADNRLIRPRGAYVGPTKQKYIPIGKR